MLTAEAWQARSLGAPDQVLELIERTYGAPEEGRLLIKVHAAGLGLPDLLMLEGAYPGMGALPAPGQEAVGVVVEAPRGSAFAAGDRVMGLTPFAEGIGGCAQYTYVRENKTRRVPQVFSDEQAAGFMLAFRSAYAALVQRVPVTEGQTLLVNGASGSTGTALVQLGKALGATVVAVARTQEQRDFCTRIGADHTIDPSATDVAEAARELTGGRGVDVFCDSVGAEPGTQALKAVARAGRVALLGYAAGSWLTVDPLDLVMRNYSVSGVYAGGFDAREDAEAYDALCDLAEHGLITTPLGSVYDFRAVPQAVASLRSTRIGKTVVRVA